MPELKNYRLLISHSWKYSTQYDTILEWLNTASNFKWSNHSVSADNPFNTKTKTALKEQLTQQIRGCNAIIVVSGMYTLYSEWIDYEINEAIRMNKPIIAIKPWILTASSTMLRRQRASQGCSQIKPQVVGNGLSLRIRRIASA